MKEPTIFRYRVVGTNAFPTDMLRYDRAFPASEQDSHRIDASLRFEDRNEPIGINGLNFPTLRRWASHGWKVQMLAGFPGGNEHWVEVNEDSALTRRLMVARY